MSRPDPLPPIRFHIGEAYAIYQGPAGDNAPHRHAAFQIAIALQGEVSLGDGRQQHSAVALVVPPLVTHQLVPAPALRIYYIEPHCAFADELRDACGPGVTAMPHLATLGEEQVERAGRSPSQQIDARLQQVMRALSGKGEGLPIPALARQAGLSPQRLRALAQEQLGMPLARWRIWRRFGLAAAAVRRGETLADAALAAGFADQAHFSRQMREMFGVSPAVLAPLMRA